MSWRRDDGPGFGLLDWVVAALLLGLVVLAAWAKS